MSLTVQWPVLSNPPVAVVVIWVIVYGLRRPLPAGWSDLVFGGGRRPWWGLSLR